MPIPVLDRLSKALAGEWARHAAIWRRRRRPDQPQPVTAYCFVSVIDWLRNPDPFATPTIVVPDPDPWIVPEYVNGS